MFCDEAKIWAKAGDGGSGMVSMRREKYVPKGGPDGGDGGRGGNIVFIANHNKNTLSNYKSAYRFSADDGTRGQERLKHGKNGEDLILKVPIGTVVKSSLTGEIIADLNEDGEKITVLNGGRGGFGNAHFKSSLYKTPRFAEKGEPGEEEELILELKLVADVGIIGFPSVGKSTFISVVSNSKPKIAEYHFTTLIPNLGVVKLDSSDFVMADIPGLIEGAADGKGLGNKFLRHIERCRILIHMLDCNSKNIAEEYLKIREELKKYSKVLAKKKEIIVINKTDTIDNELQEMLIKDLKNNNNSLSKKKIFAISSITKTGITKFLREVIKILNKEKFKDKKVEINKGEQKDFKIYSPHLNLRRDEWTIKKVDKIFHVEGHRIEQISKMTDWGNPEAIIHLKNVLSKKRILSALRKEGWEMGEPFYIGEIKCTDLFYKFE